MKFTGIALIVIGIALMLFAGVSHLVLTPTPDDINKATVLSGPIWQVATETGTSALLSS